MAIVERSNTITLEEGNINSIQITWIPEKQELEIRKYDGRYFDKYVQFGESPFTLTDFFTKLGITKKDINKAVKAMGV
jgi:hypothetical protein